jgi:two-component system chemotaxis response regulator CheB/chemosensory pili system protein ChpB (putative protein-glutamate methylesterase)
VADQASSELPRIAFVFDDATLAVHVREAMAGHAEIVYATSSSEFDATRLADARVTAALVNIDGGDWLDAIEARLLAAGVRVVFNDPEISRGLEGWERARWLRHLVAKLRGSVDFDPPRPAPSAPPPAVIAVDEPVVVAAPEVATPPETLPDSEETTVERPLSPHEIETMTADFVAVPGTPDVDAPSVQSPEVPVVAATAQVASVEELPELPNTFSEPTGEAASPSIAASDATLVSAGDPVEAADDVAGSAKTELDDATGLLDVDTEALSAMIDARLAEPEPHESSDDGEAWAISDAPAAHADTESATGDPASGDVDDPQQHHEEVSVPAGDAPAPATPVVTAGDTDADVLASLPSLDDWRLVEPDAEVAPAAAPAGERKVPEPVLPDSFAGLELVPMETIVPVERNADPIERWLDESETVRKAQADGNKQ